MDTLLLDPKTRDLMLDDSQNIALASSVDPTDPPFSEAYGQAQDAACQIKLFQGELFYDTLQGAPYWQQLLGYLPSTPLMVAKFNQAAALVTGVVATECTIDSLADRGVQTPTGQPGGTVSITNVAGQTAIVRF
jgi:hypothetical protein